MLRQALRRVLWLAPTLVLISLLAFWLLSRSQAPSPTMLELPSFFNPAPTDVESLSSELVATIATAGPEKDQAAHTLAELGGAALPHVLPRLDALGTEARTRVALALAPIARRMGITRDTDYENPSTTLRFWDRFWQDRAIDFRAASVRRAVRRTVRHPSPLRDAEVRAFDTYALEELMLALADASDAGDVPRMRHVAQLTTHTARQSGWEIPEGATYEEATVLADRWLAWWGEHAHRYVSFRGTSRVLASLSETQYGRFATRLARDFGATTARLWPRVRTTFGLLGGALVLGHALGLLLNAFALARGTTFGILGAAAPLLLLSVPPPTLAAWVRGTPSAAYAAAVAAISLVTAAYVAVLERPTMRRALSEPSAVVRGALGQSRLHATLRTTKASSGPLAARLATEVPVLMTTCFVFERALGLDGLGNVFTTTLDGGDIDVLMLVVIVTALLVGLVQLVMDLLLGLLAARHALARRRIGIFQ